jgi:hypothetical protein
VLLQLDGVRVVASLPFAESIASYIGNGPLLPYLQRQQQQQSDTADSGRFNDSDETDAAAGNEHDNGNVNDDEQQQQSQDAQSSMVSISIPCFKVRLEVAAPMLLLPVPDDKYIVTKVTTNTVCSIYVYIRYAHTCALYRTACINSLN